MTCKPHIRLSASLLLLAMSPLCGCGDGDRREKEAPVVELSAAEAEAGGAESGGAASLDPEISTTRTEVEMTAGSRGVGDGPSLDAPPPPVGSGRRLLSPRR